MFPSWEKKSVKLEMLNQFEETVPHSLLNM